MDNPIPAISKHLKAFLYGWLPLSNAYGISSVVSQSSNLTAEYAPDGGNEPPAQGSALGNKGNITARTPRQGKSVIVGRKMLLPLRGGIITRHTTPRAMPRAIWLLALQAADAWAWFDSFVP